ncbi:GNAT family N-acetyltransferase [Actinoplanes sp. NPDC048988]|uniref:GNAT family N-acetyltransferase n=1 Tax=Actinoplanes sp. NPDC048988 TaxID=3363901 RepID=UPI00371D3DD7
MFPLHETSLITSWRLLAEADPAGEVVAGPDAVTMTHSHPALCNALLRTPEGLATIEKVFAERPHAVWVREPDPALDRALEAAGYQRDERTVPMVLDLSTWKGTPAVEVVRAAPGDVAEHSGVGGAMLAEVRHTYGYATAGWESWAIAMTTDTVTNISFVTTRAEFQRRGLAHAVMTRALHDARTRGETHATLQSTPEGLHLYHRLGFHDVGTWQEWVRP